MLKGRLFFSDGMPRTDDPHLNNAPITIKKVQTLPERLLLSTMGLLTRGCIGQLQQSLSNCDKISKRVEMTNAFN